MAWQIPRLGARKTLTGKRPRRLGRAMSRRALLAAGVLGIVGIGGYAATRDKPVAVPTSDAGAVPVVNRQFAQKNTAQSPYYADLQHEEDRQNVKRASATGASYAGSIGSAANTTPPQVQQPPPAPPKPKVKMVRVDAPTPAKPPAPPAQYDPKRFAAYQRAIAAMEGQFAGITPQTVVLLKPRKGAGGKGGEPPAIPAGDPILSPGSTAAPHDPPVRSAARPHETVLVSAGHGIYARTINAVSSDDTSAPVVLEAESGPLAGDRMLGSFSETGNTRDRLVVHVNQITLANGDQKSIDALVVAPDSMATEVATSVNEHYVSRILLPAAAAFVQGLGEAIGQSGSTVVASPLGGVTEFSHVNTAQGVAAGAGAAASTVGGILASNVPNGPTVKLAADTDVGVLFLAPLKVPAGSGAR